MAGSEYYNETPRWTNHTRDPYMQESVGTSRMIERIEKMNEIGLDPDNLSDVELYIKIQKRIEEKNQSKLDPNVDSVINKYKSRASVGFEKYGTDTTREDISLQGWLTHLQEELMDATVYIERIKQDLKET